MINPQWEKRRSRRLVRNLTLKPFCPPYTDLEVAYIYLMGTLYYLTEEINFEQAAWQLQAAHDYVAGRFNDTGGWL